MAGTLSPTTSHGLPRWEVGVRSQSWEWNPGPLGATNTSLTADEMKCQASLWLAFRNVDLMRMRKQSRPPLRTL